MDNDAYEALCAFIMAQNPYADGSHVYFKPGWEAVTPIETTPGKPQTGQDKALKWQFSKGGLPDGVALVRKAMRIEYQYRTGNGGLRTEHILIGFEGDGGP